jgi:hypothetical protein
MLITGCSRSVHRAGESRVRESVIHYMTDPMFTNSDFTYQITGTRAELEMYNVDEKMLYFSINKSDFDSSSTIGKLCNNLAIVEYGREERGRINLGKYSLRGTDRFFFRFEKDDFRIDTSIIIKIDYGKYLYTISLNELADFSDNITIYGGKLDLLPDDSRNAANHGALVSKKNEPSLMRLVSQIVKEEKRKEIIAQELLNFVSGNIKFNEEEAYGRYEILKRPNEVLMTKNSDCSGLTILYASLLEQAGIDYRLVYYTGHISVGVEGNFPERNNLDFELEGKKYFIAETTAKKFIIGHTLLLKDTVLKEIRYVQKPGKDSEIIKFKNK